MKNKQNFYSKFEKPKAIASLILRIALSILSILLIFAFFRWVGIKGVISFLLGMIIMGYLLLSKNLMVKTIIDIVDAGEFLEDMKGDKNK